LISNSNRHWPLLAVLCLLAACIPKIDTGEDGGANGPIDVGPEGGIFVRNGAVLDIPKGALSTNVNITLTIIDTGIPEVPGRKRISLGYRFSPSGVMFATPIKIYLPWIEDRVPKAVDPGTFDSRRQSGSDPYLQLPGAATKLEFKTVEARTERLGLFWLTSPSEPNIARLEVTPEEVTLNVGETEQFVAKVVDPTGAAIDVTVTWSVVPPRVGSIDAEGKLTAKDPGTATVYARAGMQSAKAVVNVRGSAVGPTSWLHENPYPTGNDLWGGTLAPGGLGSVFVGANATILARDLTNQWTRLFSSPTVVLKAIGGTTLENAVAVGISGSSGVVIEMKGASAAPVVKVFASCEPRALWYDGTHGMAVGYGNDVLVRRNGTWVTEYSPSFETLLSVVGDGLGGFVTVGSRGSIYKYDPVKKAWDSLYQTQLSTLLTAGVLLDAAGTEAWAVGGNKLWHFTAGGWTAANLPPAPVITEATTLGVVDGRVVIGGRANKTGYALLFDPNAPIFDGGIPPFDAGVPDAGDPDGGALDGGESDGGVVDAGVVDAGVPLPQGWNLVAWRAPQIPRGFFGGGIGSTTGYMVGDLGAIWQYGSGTFTEVSRGFYGAVRDLAATDAGVYAVVNDCVNATCSTKTGSVYTRVGPGDWQLLGGPQPFGNELFAIAAKGKDVVVSTPNAIYRYDGTVWSAITTGGITGPIRDLRHCGQYLYGVGMSGTFFKGSSTLLQSQGTAGNRDLFSIHCPNDLELWVAGTGSLFSKTGTGVWVARGSTTVNHADYRAVWSPGQGEALAFGDARYGTYWNTAELSVIDGPGGVLPDIVSGMWGSSIDNLYAVGNSLTPAPFGFALRFDGINWRLVDSGSQRAVTAIDGWSPSEIWLGTEGGGILRAVPPK
jgi:hypothetical protein